MKNCTRKRLSEKSAIEVRLDPEYKLPKVIILTDKVTDEVNAINPNAP